MKKFCLFTVFAALATLCAAAEKTQTQAPAAETKTVAPAKCDKPAAETEAGFDFRLSRIARGVTNVATCPLELPRCMVLGNSAVPFWGFVAGAVDGVGTTAMRAFSGVTDVLFLGFDAGTVYNEDFREFVWESRWQQPKKQAKTTNAKP